MTTQAGHSSENALKLEITDGNIGRITFDQPGSRATTSGIAGAMIRRGVPVG